MDTHQNFIGGEWVDGRHRQAQRQPVQHSTTWSASTPAPTRAGRAGDRRRARRPSRLVARRTPQQRADVLDRDRHRDPRAQGRARHAARARGGQDAARGHRRGDARRRRSSSSSPARRCASPGEQRRLGPARHRGRGHARAGRRGRPHHALELPDRDPGLEDRAGARLRQLRRVQAGRPRAGLAPGRWPRSSPRGRARRACSTS